LRGHEKICNFVRACCVIYNACGAEDDISCLYDEEHEYELEVENDIVGED